MYISTMRHATCVFVCFSFLVAIGDGQDSIRDKAQKLINDSKPDDDLPKEVSIQVWADLSGQTKPRQLSEHWEFSTGKIHSLVSPKMGVGKQKLIRIKSKDCNTSGLLYSLRKGKFLKIEAREGMGEYTLLEDTPFDTGGRSITLLIDGKVALGSGESQWITSELSRRHAHLLRSKHDAILVGVGTVLKDNPMLSTRLDGLDHNPVRIVLDSDLQIPADSILVKSAYALRLWVFHTQTNDNEINLIANGAILHQVNKHDLGSVLQQLAKEGITRVLVEGGPKVHASFLRQGLWDEMVVYRAPSMIGHSAVNVSGDLDIDALKDRYDMKRESTQMLGDDTLERYVPKGEE